MKFIALTFIIAASTALAGNTEPLSLAFMPLQAAQLQPATGLDMARGLGERGSVRIQPDSADAWKTRFPKRPNGQPR